MYRILCALLSLSLLACQPPAAVSPAMYTFESTVDGFHTKTIFYDDGQEVVAFDAQFTAAQAQAALDFLETQTKSPLRYLVVTHPNPDKFNGIPTFQQAGAQVIMSRATQNQLPAVHQYKKHYFVHIAGSFTETSYPSLPSTDIVFDNTYTISLANGGKVVLTELHRQGISSNQTIAEIPDQATLIVGDLIHHKAHAWLEGPIVNGQTAYDGTAWIQTLEFIQTQYPDAYTIYGGRGSAAPLSTAITDQINYLRQAETITLNYVQSLPGATLTDQKAAVDYAVLQQRFEQAFPSYALGYMVAYGAYGLVNSL